MATHWGGLVSRQQAGIEHVITSETATVRNARTRILQRTNFASFNFDGQAWWGGIQSGSNRGRLSGSNTFVHATFYSSHTRYFGAGREVWVNASSVTHSPGQTAASYVSGPIWVPPRPATPPGAPGFPAFSHITQTNVRVSLPATPDGGAPIVEWGFQRATNAAMTENLGTWNHIGNLLDISSFGPNRTNFFRGRARNAAGWGPWGSVNHAVTAPGVPSQTPTPVIQTPAQPTGLTATWAAPNDNGAAFNGMQVQIATNSAFTANLVTHEGPWSTSHTFTDRAPNSRQYVRVRARNSVGWGAWSGSTWIVLPTAQPAAPANLAVSNVQAHTANVSWSLPNAHGASLTGQRIEWSGDNFASLIGGVNLAAGATSAQITNLAANAPHQVRVRGTNVHGNGGWSTVTFNTPARTPDAPGNLRITDTQTEAATIAWNAPFNGGVPITGYRVEWSLNGFVNTESLETTGTTATLAPLVPGTAYSVRVRAINSVGNGAWASMPLTTLPGVYVRAEGQWRPALAHVRVAGVWRRARVWKRANGAWHL